MASKELDEIEKVALDYIKDADPKMKWTWGEGLVGYAFSELDSYRKEEEFVPFLAAYCTYYLSHQPEICSSDTCAPGLIAYAMQKKLPDRGFEKLTEAVLKYIKEEPRILDGVPNHFGHNKMSKLYPQSIWVDSLMMFSLFPAIYASENNDQELLNYAAGLPKVFSEYLQDLVSGLWYHSYWVKEAHTCPKAPVFWGRGNGWVVASLPLVYERLNEGHPAKQRIQEIFLKTVDGMRKYQQENGMFTTILNKSSYEETSCTALYAAGVYNGIRLGLLDKYEYEESAKKAFAAVLNHLKEKKGKLVMTGISGPTIPLPPFTALNYQLIAKKDNWSYGVAALIFAGLAFDKYQSEAAKA